MDSRPLVDRLVNSIFKTMDTPKSKVPLKPLDVECWSCGAQPGEHCQTASGKKTRPHVERFNTARRRSWR